MRLVAVIVACFALLFASCAEPVRPELEIAPPVETLEAGQTVKLTVTRRYLGGSSRDATSAVAYSSSNRNVASITRDGVLTAGPETGTTTIRIVDDATDTATSFALTVLVPAAQRIVSIDVTPGTLVIQPGELRQFNAQARFADGTVRDVTRNVQWASSDTSVALVGATSFDYGLVRAVASGQTQITATDPVSRVQGQSTVFVPAPPTQLQAIVVTPNPAGPIGVGATVQLVATGFTANGAPQDVTTQVQWQSSVPGVATVTGAGLATGVAAGDTTITAVGATVRGSAALKVQ